MAAQGLHFRAERPDVGIAVAVAVLGSGDLRVSEAAGGLGIRTSTVFLLVRAFWLKFVEEATVVASTRARLEIEAVTRQFITLTAIVIALGAFASLVLG